jgi:hypothetical protein
VRDVPSTTDPLRAAHELRGAAADELLRAAAEAAGLGYLGARLRSVHERGGRSVSTVHEAVLEVDGDRRDVLLVAHVDRRGFPDGAFVLTRGTGEQVAVWRFPHDPYLPGLPSAISPDRVRELLDQLGAPSGDVTLFTRAYRPSRRAVVEVRIDGPEAAGRVLYLKVLSGSRVTELAELHRALVSSVPVPPVVGVADAQGILALGALPGRTLRAALVEGWPVPAPEALVSLSERVAASGVRSSRDPRGFADPTRHVAGLAALLPARAEELRDLAEQAAAVDGPTVPVHGDLHDGQLLLDDDGSITGLLDVDGAGTGFLAHDAGNLVAHVAVIGEIWPEVAARTETYADELAAAYAPLVGAEALARATAGAWIGLATGPYRAQDTDWEERTHARLDRAAASLAAIR